MKVETAPGFPYPQMFFVAGRAAGAAFPPVQAVGALIVKQTISVSGASIAQENVAMTDVEYAGAGPGDLAIQFEADLVPSKPVLDLVVVRASRAPGVFGTFQIDRGLGFSAAAALPFGWQDRRTGARALEAGDVVTFTPPAVPDPANPPPLEVRLALPNNFRNAFFNGGQVSGLTHLKGNDAVRFDDGAMVRQLTVPPGPVVAMVDGPAPVITTTADTVVYDIPGARFLVTWRSVFAWSPALEAATLRVA